MVETCHLQPPVSGPQSDPLLFGVAEALALIFPVEPKPERPVVVRQETAPERIDGKPVPDSLAA